MRQQRPDHLRGRHRHRTGAQRNHGDSHQENSRDRHGDPGVADARPALRRHREARRLQRARRRRGGHDELPPTGCAFISAATSERRTTMRGPQREAMSSLRPSTRPSFTAVEIRPTGPLRHRGARLAAADRVGQQDVARVRLQDELAAQLRVPAAGRGPLRRVGDAVQTEQAEHLPDEGARGGRVVGLVELVVVGRAVRGLVDRGDDARDLALDLGHLRPGLGFVSGELAQLVELRVLLRQVGRSGIADHRDARARRVACPRSSARRTPRPGLVCTWRSPPRSGCSRRAACAARSGG